MMKFDKAKSHMARPKDRGGTDCNDNSIKTTQRKHLRTGRAREKKRKKSPGRALQALPLWVRAGGPTFTRAVRARARARAKYPGLSKLAFFVV